MFFFFWWEEGKNYTLYIYTELFTAKKKGREAKSLLVLVKAKKQSGLCSFGKKIHNNLLVCVRMQGVQRQNIII